MRNRALACGAALAVLASSRPVDADEPGNTAHAHWFHDRRELLSGAGSSGLVRPALFTGGAELSIPIEIPRGTGGFEPSLAIHYSSRKGRANMGVGWSVALPAITRSTKYGTDLAQTPSFEAYELNGEELVKHGTSENNCDRYYPRSYEFQKILHCPLTNHWEIHQKDGTRYEFGTTPFSRYTNTTLGVTFEWHLDRAENLRREPADARSSLVGTT